MTRLLRGLGIAAIAVGMAAGALVLFAPVSGFKAPLEAEVTAATGRAFHIEGPLSLSLTPDIALDLGAVTLGAGQGQNAAPLVTAQRAVLAVAFLPLLAGEARATGLTLQGADIVIAPDGGGWTLTPADGTERASLFDALAFGDVTLIDSHIRIGDIDIEARDLRLRWPQEGHALSLSGEIVFRETNFAIEAVIERRDRMVAGGRVPLRIEFQSALAYGSLDGVADLAGLSFEGGVSLSASSARALASFFGAALPGEQALGALSLSAAVKASPGLLQLRDAKFALGDMTGDGALAITHDADRPGFSGTISVDHVALGDWLGVAQLPDNGGWRDAAFDVSGLSQFDADLTVKARSADFAGLQVQGLALTASVGGGRLWARIDSALAYAAILRGTVTVETAAGTPVVALTLSGEGFDAQSLLAAAFEAGGLAGKANVKLDLTAKGPTRRAMIDSLGGSIGLVLIDGTLDGLDPAELARTAADDGGPQGLGDAEAVTFKRLSGSFALQNGRARSTTIRLVSNYVQMDAAGAFDLGARTLAVRVFPAFTAAADGSRDPDDEGRLAMPFVVTGTWGATTAQPDWPALAEALQSGKLSPEAAELLPEPRRSWFKDLMARGEAPPWPPGIEPPGAASWQPW